MSLAELFADSEYEVNPALKDARVVRLGTMFGDAPLFMQPSLGVPLGGGVLAALTDVMKGSDQDSPAAQLLGPALRFGWRVAAGYMDAVASTEPGWDVADVIMVAEVMALAFGQVHGVLAGLAFRGSLMKNWIPVAVRHDLADVGAELQPQVREFLTGQSDRIRELFAEEFEGYWPAPGFSHAYNTALRLPVGTPVELWDIKFSEQHTVGQLLDEVLRTADGERMGQEDTFDIGRADSGGLDRRGASGPGGLPLVVLEMRRLERYKYDPQQPPHPSGLVGYQRMDRIIVEMADLARRGEAAAELARRLQASLEGELVVAWLRQAAAAPAGAERDRAARLLFQAARWYLGQFPDEAEALKLILGPLAEVLGLAGGFDAAILPGAPPALRGRWAGVAARYETEYAAVRSLARAIALPPGALRALVGDLAELAGPAGLAWDADVDGSLPEVLRSQDIRQLLGGIGREVRVHGGAELMVLVNDLLMATSLVPPGLVSPRRLASMLREISDELAADRDPLAAPALAGTGYQADEPLAVRLARLALVNLSNPARTRLAGDPLFQRMLTSPLLGAALFAASGTDEQFLACADGSAAADQVLLARVPTIAGLLLAGRERMKRLRGREGVGGGALAEAAAEFAAIATAAETVLDEPGDDPGAASGRLGMLTLRWAEAMRKLEAGAPESGRPGARVTGADVDDQLAAVNRQLTWPLLPPTRPLAEGLRSNVGQAAFWDLVRGEGGIVVRTGRRLLSLRAMRRDGHRVFVFAGPGGPGYGEVPLEGITDWAQARQAQVHEAYLPGSPVAGTPPGLVAAGRRAAEQAGRYLTGDPTADLDAGQQGHVVLSLLAAPPLPGKGFRQVALVLLRAADDRALAELFGDDGALLTVLSARIPDGDALRGELDDFIDSRFAGGWSALAAGTVQPAGQPWRAFSPGFLDGRLEGAGKAGTFSKRDISAIIAVASRSGSERIIRQLRRLPVVQRARAARWMASAQLAIRSGAAADPGDALRALTALDAALAWVYEDTPVRPAQGARLAGFDGGSLDRAWGKLVTDGPGAQAVDEAVTRARELIGRPGLVVWVQTDKAIDELDPLAQAVRFLALWLLRNPGDDAGAASLAGTLTARLDEVLGPLSAGRLSAR